MIGEDDDELRLLAVAPTDNLFPSFLLVALAAPGGRSGRREEPGSCGVVFVATTPPLLGVVASPPPITWGVTVIVFGVTWNIQKKEILKKRNCFHGLCE